MNSAPSVQDATQALAARPDDSTSPVRTPLCPMMRAFGRDTGSSFHLTRFLVLNELALLVGTCSPWKHWLSAPRTLSKRRRMLSPAAVPLFADCEWVRQHVDTIELSEPLNAAASMSPVDSDEPADLARALTLLPAFQRLHWLAITSRGLKFDLAAFEICFRGLGGSLLHLELNLPMDGETEHNDAIIQAYITHARHLTKLRELRIVGMLSSQVEIDFSSLSALPLEMLRMGQKCYDFCLTAAQTKDICKIQTLTNVDLGSWQRLQDVPIVDGAITPEAAERNRELIDAFAQSRQGASPIRLLTLGRAIMTPDFWDHICTFSALESIWPWRWRGGMTSRQWSQLQSFKNLRKLSVCPDLTTAAVLGRVVIDDVLAGLGYCSTLIEIQLGEGFLLRPHDVEQIVQNLPALGCFVLFHCRVETLAPMINAPSLTALDLRGCMDQEGSPPHWRITLPSLPRLTDLIIVDSAGTQLRPNQAEPLNAALLARMPSLTLAKFTQNLLPPVADNDDED